MNPGRERYASIVSWLVVVLLTLIVAQPIVPLIETYLFSGVPIPAVTVKVLLAVILCLVIVQKYRHRSRGSHETGDMRRWFIPGLIVFGIAVIIGIALLQQDVPLQKILHSYSAYYAMLFFVVLVGAAGVQIRQRQMEVYLLLSGVSFALLGIVQFALQAPLFDLPKSMHARDVSVMMYGTLRAFSLFASPYALGMYLSLVWLVVLHRLCEKSLRQVSPWILVAGVVVLMGLVGTLNRTAWLQAGLSTVFYCYFRWKPRQVSLRRYAPLAFFAIAAVMLQIIERIPSLLQQSLISNETLSQRVHQWNLYLDIWQRSGTYGKLFGLGVFQHADYLSILIDSNYLAILLHSGLLGLGGLLVFYSLIWGRVLHAHENAGTSVVQPYLAYMAPFAAIMLLQVENIYYPFATILVLMVLPRNESGE